MGSRGLGKRGLEKRGRLLGRCYVLGAGGRPGGRLPEEPRAAGAGQSRPGTWGWRSVAGSRREIQAVGDSPGDFELPSLCVQGLLRPGAYSQVSSSPRAQRLPQASLNFTPNCQSTREGACCAGSTHRRGYFPLQ